MNKFISIFVLFFAFTGRAGIPVIDTASIAKTILVLEEMGKQLKNQLRQIEAQEAFFAKQVQKLNDLGYKDTYKISEHLKYFADLRNNLDNTVSDYQRLDAEFRKLYKTNDAPVEKKIQNWESATEDSLFKAMKSHAAMGDSARKLKALEHAANMQKSAQGDLAAIQALGEITKILVQQIEELKTIISLDAKAKQTHMMEEKSKEELMRAHEKHLVSDLRKKSSYKKITKLPDLQQGNS